MTIHHISVDFWHTLAEPNKAYGLRRNTILADHYLCQPAQAGERYKELKNSWEQLAVSTGLVPDVETLRQQMNLKFDYKLSQRQFAVMLQTLEDNFLLLPPIICDDSLHLLRQLKAAGLTLSVSSNTNFIIRGRVLSGYLPDNLFSFQLFSDQLGYCKPSPVFWSSVLMQAGRVNGLLTQPQQILHVGDSVECDGVGASAMGMDTHVCHKNNPLSKILATVER